MVFEVICKNPFPEMKRILWFASIIFSIGFVTVNISCSSNIEKQQVKFYYYPKTNVYFDVAKKKYIYSLDGGKTWGNISSTSDKEPTTLGKRLIIYSTTDSIWKQNEAHRKQYAGTLYNIINQDNIASVGSEVIERRLVHNKSIKPKVKVITYKAPEEKPEKKRTFFQKVFGKNKNKK